MGSVFSLGPWQRLLPLQAWLAVLAALLLLSACAAAERAYEDEIAAWRAEKDRFMRSSESPLPHEDRPSFPPLPYYDVSEQYRVPAVLRAAASEPFEMPTSTGQRRWMRRVGKLEFTVHGEQHALTAFADQEDRGMRRLFVPFRDLTNGIETYPAGRYLDLDRTATGYYELDFNRAYHPFCLFNEEYDCPLPPPENRLEVAVRAGERLPLDVTTSGQ